MNAINRRHFLKVGGAATLGAGTLPLFSGRALAATTLTGVTYLPQSYQALSYGMNGFVQRLGEAKDVTVDYYDSAKLVKADEQVTTLRSGLIDFMFHTTSYITRSTPILGVTGLPVLCEELYTHGDRLAIGTPLFELINEQLASEDLIMLSAGGGMVEPEYIWSTKATPIRSIADLSGKKVRIVSVEATQALEKYGAAAVRVPSSETYLALQRGTIDAAVANISTVVGRSLQEQLATVYRLPTTGYTICLFMLKSRWEKLDAGVKAAIKDAAGWYDQNFASYINKDHYPNKYWPMMKEAGIEIVEPSAEDVEKFRNDSQAVWDAWKGEVGADIGQRAIDMALGKA